MKKLLIIFMIVCALAAKSAFGTHLAGGYITYEYVSTNNYMLRLALFRDCSQGAAALASSQIICCYSQSFGLNVLVTLTLDTSYQVPYNTCAAIGNVVCDSSYIYAYEKYFYSALCTLPVSSSDWKFSFTLCCRNNAITTLVNPGSSSIYLEATLDNLTNPVNSSPSFNSMQFSLYCAGVFTNIDYSVTDADGDSVVYTLDPAGAGPTSCPSPITYLIYAPPYSAAYPLASFTPVTLNYTSGIFSFTPALQQVGVVSVLVREYRNGILIGSIKRDDQVPVVIGIQNPDVAEGHAWFDMNANGTFDTNENHAAGKVIQEASGLATLTDTSGNYHFDFIPGNYSISTVTVPYYSIVPASHTVSFSALGQYSGNNDFALQPVPGITDLSVTLSIAPVIIPGGFANLNIQVMNPGTDTSGGNLSLNYDTAYQFINSSDTPSVSLPGSLTWNIAPLLPGQLKNIQAVFQLDSLASIGSVYAFTGNIPMVTDTTPFNNEDSVFQTVQVSFDPNEKFVEPAQPLTASFFTNGQFLNYTITFQNTGTAPAQNIIIYDPLDLLLDKATFSFAGSSHSCVPMIDGNGLLTFAFTNINLPPAITNEPLSHGYVSFHIKPVSSMQPGQSIVNSAGIVFDANVPVFTNYVYSYYPQVTGINILSNHDFPGAVYPNPASGFFYVSMKEEGKYIFQLFDLSGRIVLSKYFSRHVIINTETISNGVYLFRAGNSKTGMYTGKEVIVH